MAGGYKMATKAEHHDSVRNFVKSLKPPLKLSLPALETLAVVAYKQPVTAPEIMEIRGVQGTGVLKTLLDRKLIAVAGRKNVIGKPILYKTTKEFLIQFGLKDLSELPSLKEFEAVYDGQMILPLEPMQEPSAETAPAETPPAETTGAQTFRRACGRRARRGSRSRRRARCRRSPGARTTDALSKAWVKTSLPRPCLSWHRIPPIAARKKRWPVSM